MGLVTTFCPLMMTGAVELVFQTFDKTRLVAYSKVKPVSLVGHDKTRSAPENWRFILTA